MLFMRRVMTGGILAGLLFVAAPAWSDDAAPAPVPAPVPGLTVTVDWSRLAADFDAALGRYLEWVEFTRRLEAAREKEEERAFEQALDRHERALELTELLVVMHEQELEQEFEQRVEQYVRKLTFTHDLVTTHEDEPAGR
jgi:hypothetical protein